MKWFQHQTDASDDIKVRRLEYKFGLEGYAIYFKLLEKVAKEGKNHRLDLKKFPIGFLASAMNVQESKISDCLTEMSNLSLITLKSDEIYVPNMKKYTDNWSKRTTKKLQSNYRVTTEQLPKDKNRIDKNRIEYIGDLKKSPTHELTQFFFSLKDDEYVKAEKPKYGRHTKDAKELLDLCDGNLDTAKSRVEKLAEWADDRSFDWNLGTVIKKFLEV